MWKKMSKKGGGGGTTTKKPVLSFLADFAESTDRTDASAKTEEESKLLSTLDPGDQAWKEENALLRRLSAALAALLALETAAIVAILWRCYN